MITRDCPSCHTANRVPARFLALTGRCGSCKGALPPLGEPIEATEANFDQIITEARVPVLVDFWADWCGPCKMAAPEVAALARELAGKAIVLKVDTGRNPNLAARYRIQSIPNFIVFQNGRPTFQRAGVAPRTEMRRWIEQAAA